MKNAKVSVRECNFKDAADLVAIGTLLNAYINDHFGGGEPLDESQRLNLAGLLYEHPKSIILLAKVEADYCGMIVAFENISTFSVKPIIYIHDVIVLSEYRGLGIGKCLMESIVAVAKDRGCARITLEVREDNVTAQHLYKKIGFGDTEPKMFYWQKNL